MAILLVSSGGQAWADTTVHARLHEQNGSGVSGAVTLTATDAGELVVHIVAHGMMPGPHAQHIHGSQEGGHFMCASMADDTDGDGVLTNEEGSGEYGTIFMALTTRGDTSASSGLALERMPVADADGDLSYRRTIPADAIPVGLLDQLAHLHVVQHGIDVNDNDEYDLQALGESTFAKSLGLPNVPEEATDPAACGVVVGAGAGMPAHGGVETGGGDPSDTPIAPIALGAVLLTASLIALGWWRRRSATTEG
jgi:hypothetical protein